MNRAESPARRARTKKPRSGTPERGFSDVRVLLAVAFLEAIDTATGIEHLVLAGVEGV
jgi:hypothetical protein